MQNNCITILIDSVFADCISSKKTSLTSTPFIDEIAKSSLVADNIYSYGPYTDAATIGLYNGIPTLSNFGYYYGINSSDYNHFRVFNENGYETYGLFYPYYLLSSKVRKYINHPIYTCGFKYSSVWNGKFEYFSKIREKRNLTDFEYKMMEKCVEMVFNCWIGFYEEINKNAESQIIVKTLYDKTINGLGLSQLKIEFKKFDNNRRDYINELLTLGMNHPLARVNEFDYGKECDKQFLKEIYKRHKKFIRKLKIRNFFCNVRNTSFSVKKAIKSIYRFILTRDKVYLRYIANYGMLLFSPQMMIKRSLKQRNWQEMASLDKQINTFFENIDCRSEKNVPFYASLHVLEPHHNISFFSFDCFDIKQIDSEIEYISPLIDNCGRKFGGNLLYQLSLRYVDLCVKRLFEGLEKRGMLEHTTIALVADHGSSYFFNPLRTHVVNSFHKENYNIPLLIFNQHLNKGIIGKYNGYYMSEDILPTLFGINGIPCPKQMKGHKIYESHSDRAYIITEYMGPGVPDMVNKEVWMSVRNSNYVIAYTNSINVKMNLNKPVVVYDLKNDPNELHNIASTISIKNLVENEDVNEMLLALEKRFEEIVRNRDSIMANFDDFYVK